MTTQDEHNRDIEYMRQKLKEADWGDDGRISGHGYAPDHAKYDRMTPDEVRRAYKNLHTDWSDR